MNRKIIWKFNIIDLVIMGIVALSLVALIYRSVAGGDDDKKMYKITYICEEAPLNLLYQISEGCGCVDGEQGTELGVVTGVSAESFAEGGNKGRGIIYTQAEGEKAEHGITIDSSAYLKGKTLSLIIEDSVFEVYIDDIK